MQKVVGSSPISRFLEDLEIAGLSFLRSVETHRLLQTVHESLDTLLYDSRGTARLITADDQVALAITLDGAWAPVSGRPAQTRFDGVAINKRELEPAPSALEFMVHAYPRRP